MKVFDIIITIIGFILILFVLYQHDDFSHIKEDSIKRGNKAKEVFSRKFNNKQTKSSQITTIEDEEDEEVYYGDDAYEDEEV